MDKNSGSDDRLLRAQEVAQMFGLSVKTIYALATAGTIPTVRLTPRSVRFRRSAIVEWVEQRECEAA